MSILAICGSTRQDSVNHRLIESVRRRLEGRAEVRYSLPIDSLPHFNPDLDQELLLPAVVADFREACASAQAILICTPEYVFSLPGSLKNALEWLVSTTILQDRRMALITAAATGEKAHESLQLIIRTMGGDVPAENQLLISGARSRVDAQGDIADEGLRQAMDALVEGLVAGDEG